MVAGGRWMKSESFHIGNRFVDREITISKGTIRTRLLHNKLTGKKLKIASREFMIRIDGGTVLTNRDFTVQERVLRKGRLRFLLSAKKHELDVELIYTIRPRDFYMHKVLGIMKTDHLVNEIDVESFRISGAPRFTFGGFGQPIFVDRQLFIGLEYPAGHNIARMDKSISLRHYPGRTGRITSKRAVIGVCPDTVNNRIRDWFLKYVENNRARKRKGFFLVYGQTIPQRHRGSLAAFKSIEYWEFEKGRKLFAKYGISVDALYVKSNQAWVDPQSVMGELPEAQQFVPLGLIQKEAKEQIGASMGFHLNTGGGRNSSDHKWFAKHFDMISERYYCLADPRVSAELGKNLLHLQKKYQAKWFMFDWLWWKKAWECPKRGHRGHLHGARYSREAITDSFIKLTRKLRRQDPDVYLDDLEVELSPWWLFYADSLWNYVGEGAVISDEEIDICMKTWLEKNTVFPLLNTLHSGALPRAIPARKTQAYIRRLSLENELWNYLRGSEMHGSSRNEELVRVMAWAETRKDILLANTTPMLVNGGDCSVHGYAHFLPDNQGLVGLRNYSLWKEADISLRLDERAHFYRRENAFHRAKIIYPYEEVLPGLYTYDDTLELKVAGGRLLVLEIVPVKKGEEAVGSSGDKSAAGKQERLAVRDLTLDRATKRKPVLKGRFTVQIPKKAKASLWLGTELWERELEKMPYEGKEEARMHEIESEAQILEHAGQEVSCRITVNGRQRSVVRFEKMNKLPFWIGRHPQKRSKHYYRVLYTDKLASGRISFCLKSPFLSTRQHVWIETETPSLPENRITGALGKRTQTYVIC